MDRNAGVRVRDVLSRVFALYRAHFGSLIPVAFCLFVVIAVARGIVGRHEFVPSFAIAVATGAASLIYQGMVVGLIGEDQGGGRDASVGELFRSVGPVLLPLIGAGLVFGIGVAIGLFLLVIPACFLLTIWAVVAPAIVIERKGVRAAFGRSRDLVRGYRWPVFGAVVVALLITAVTSVFLDGVAVTIVGGPLLRPDGTILRIVLDALDSTLTVPVLGLLPAVLYHRLLELKGESPPPLAA